jgi:hypothetical protein
MLNCLLAIVAIVIFPTSYMAYIKQTSSSRLSYDVAVRQRLWKVSEELIRQNELTHLIPEK